MPVKYGIYKCDICGNIISMVYDGGGDLVCCGQEMTLLKVKTMAEEGKEKHVPVLEAKGNIVTVKIGSIPHPMEEKHHIMLIRLLQSGNVIAEKYLQPGEKPEATFIVEKTTDLQAQEYCNLHGLWTS
jgi:superoxide reductase